MIFIILIIKNIFMSFFFGMIYNNKFYIRLFILIIFSLLIFGLWYE